MKTVRAKAFVAAIREFYHNKRKFKSYFDDKRLTQLEKTILQCFIWINDAKSSEALDSLLAVTPCGDPIVDAERELLIGIAFNNKADHKKSIPYLYRSIEMMKGSPLKNRVVTAYCSLFYAYYNLKDNEGMKKVMPQLQDSTELSSFERINLLSCKLCFANVMNDFSTSETLIGELKELGAEMTETHKTGFYLDCFDFYFKTDNFKKCYETLQEITRLKKIHLGANYKFMKGVLDNITANKPLYLYETYFAEYPVLLYQMKILKALEQKEMEEAETYWHKLRESSPLVYKSNFNYEGDKCLFSVCLKKHLPKLTLASPRVTTPPEGVNKVLLVMELLRETTGPINKEELYRLVYGEDAFDKEDFKKLAQLVYKTRQLHQVEIKIRKGCYYLDKDAA